VLPGSGGSGHALKISLGGDDKGGAGCFAGPEFMRSLREEEPRMTNSSSPSCYRRSLPIDVRKLTSREKFEKGLRDCVQQRRASEGRRGTRTPSLSWLHLIAPLLKCWTAIDSSRSARAVELPFQLYWPVAEALEGNKRRSTSLKLAIGGRGVR
jgi:hypothetical protein